MRRVLTWMTLCSLAATAALAQTAAPSLLAAAIARTQSARMLYAYEVAVESEQGRLRYEVNPALRGDARVRVLEPAESALSSQARDAVARARREADGDIWCASPRLQQARNVRLLREDAQASVFAFTPSPEQVGSRGGEIARYLRGEAQVSREAQDVSALRLHAPAPFRASIARIDAFTMDITCAAAPNGRLYAARSVTTMRGSALTRQFDVRTTQRVSRLRPVS